MVIFFSLFLLLFLFSIDLCFFFPLLLVFFSIFPLRVFFSTSSSLFHRGYIGVIAFLCFLFIRTLCIFSLFLSFFFIVQFNICMCIVYTYLPLFPTETSRYSLTYFISYIFTIIFLLFDFLLFTIQIAFYTYIHSFL